MKRNIILLFALAFVVSMEATTFIVEDMNPDIVVSQGETELTVAEVVIDVTGEDIVPALITFYTKMETVPMNRDSLPSRIHVTLDVDEKAVVNNMHGFWLEDDHTKVYWFEYEQMEFQSNGFWQMYLEPGLHVIAVQVSGGYEGKTEYLNTVLQIRYDTPDQAAVCEQSDDDGNYDPLPQSLITASNSLILPGAIAVYDKVGREIDGVIYGDRINMDALPAGQYFIRTNTASNHVLKVVKIR